MKFVPFAVSLLVVCVNAFGQFGSTGSSTLSVTIPAEAGIRIDTPTTMLSAMGGGFGNFTGSTQFTYKIRTTQSTGTGTIQVQVTSDFSPANGPSVASPPSPGDTLGYTCTVASPGTACAGTQTASTTTATPIATFTAGASSASAGNSGNLNWTLTNDPAYRTGSYTATVTFTISAT